MANENQRKMGALFHAKHAFKPNSLGYCGPDDRGSILEHLHDSNVTPSLLQNLQEFEAAYPFIALIAKSTGRDVFDYRVPEAYWIGNDLLDQVPVRDFYSFSHSKLQGRNPAEVRRLFRQVGATARPHHTFHVLSTFTTPIIGDGPHLGNEQRRKVEALVDNCRISWGEVVKVGKDTLVVERRPVKLVDAEFELAGPARVKAKFDRGIAPFDRVKVGDWLSLHWGFACDVISVRQVRNAARFTAADIASVNRALKPGRET